MKLGADPSGLKMSTLAHCCKLLQIATLAALSWQWCSSPVGQVQGASSVADSYPVMVDDGEDGFLILNDDEVAQNSQLLKHISGASKEEVEEIVDSNPHVQDMILDRIKQAVDRRREDRASRKGIKAAKGATSSEGQQTQVVQEAQPEKTVQQAQVPVAQQEENDDDDDDQMDDVKVAALRAKLKTKAAKVFKVGAKFKEKLSKFMRKKDTKKGNRNQGHRRRWPHFHYRVSTSTDGTARSGKPQDGQEAGRPPNL